MPKSRTTEGLPENPFESYIGSLPEFSSVQEINNWISSMRDPEDFADDNGA